MPASQAQAQAAASATLASLAGAEPPIAEIISRDARGNGRLLQGTTHAAAIASGLSTEAAARFHLLRHASALGLDQGRSSAVTLQSSQKLAGGAALLRFDQRVLGLEVFHARASVVLDHANNLVSLASNLAAQPTQGDAPTFTLNPAAALAQAYAAHTGVASSEAAASDIGSAADSIARAFTLATPQLATRVLSATVKPVLFPAEDSLLPAHHIELVMRAPDSAIDQGYGYVIAASDGRVLWSASLTHNEAFTYRVWADPNGDHTPTDGPLLDSTPHATGLPDQVEPGFTAPILVTTGGFNKNPAGASDPWLDASATFTFGNNVRAYSDRNQTTSSLGVPRNDGFNQGVDLRAETTAALTFDRTFDNTREPDVTPDQIKAAVTQMFYVTNWLHDYFYDSGFDEASGNAQLSNFGRGGTQNDPLLAEAQDSADSGEKNNANMTILGDGSSPRMQMYVFSGPPTVTLATSAAVTFDDVLGFIDYGPDSFDIGAQNLPLVLVDDNSTTVPSGGTGPGTKTDGCQRASNVSGKLAVVDRGGCLFSDKLTNLQSSGAKAVLVLDNAPGHNAPRPSSSEITLDIPVLTVSYEDGQKLKPLLSAAEPVTATGFKRIAGIGRDGTIDNTIVAHEWGHYLHHRLVDCSSASCDGMSEGWGDFNSLMLTIREGDTFPGKAYPTAQYASAGIAPNAMYFGIRRAPYSVELDKNPFTFKHIRAASKLPTGAPLGAAGPELNEAHNVGEIWAEMLFEGYANLLTTGVAAGRSFDESKRRMADYVVAGMKAAPTDPTFVEQRDAILSVIRAMAKGDTTREADFTALASGFAKRGLGAGAVAPSARSTTLNEAVESFSVPTL